MKKGQTNIGSKLRNNLTNKFLEDLSTVYQETGIGAIRSFRQEDPVKFCIMIANLLPKDISVDITENKLNELSDDQINELIERIQILIGSRLAEVEDRSTDGEAPTLN